MAEASSSSRINPTDHLPLSIHRSDIIPPAPTRSRSTIDWIPDFSGYAWIAYGASSLLVISHLPSPLSSGELIIAPILRQVFELSDDHSSPVAAVSWSPVTPSVGELAAASGNCIFVFSHDSTASKGSFCWSQNAVLVQSSKVEAIEWTGSADGIISGGSDVVLWRRKSRSWEIAWKLKTDVPQNLISATWSIDGHFAAASYLNRLDDERPSKTSNSVLVNYCNSSSEYLKHELRHPRPVSMIQWRPSIVRRAPGDAKHPRKHMLLTCCLDGTVRLWTEVESGKVRKLGKDNNDFKSMRISFCVSAVIEINQTLNGSLGMDIFLNWATESSGVYRTEEGTNWFSSEINGHDRVGECEWLIGFGPGTVITFWAIHCLDDVSPIRFPRVTLWKRQEFQDLDRKHVGEVDFSKFKDSLPLNKVVLLRDCLSGPPDICSLVHLLPCNSLVWSLLNTRSSSGTEATSLSSSKIYKYLHSSSGDVINGGHAGKNLQVAIHPCIYELGLAASLDSNGLLLFWSVSKCNVSLSELIPSWKLKGRLATRDSCPKYTSLKWAPSMLDEDCILLMGHAGGIDCFVVKVSENGRDMTCHYVCTIPLTGCGPYANGPANIYVISLPSPCTKTFKYNKFMLMGVWVNSFKALSWEVTLHSYTLQGSLCECGFDDQSNWTWKFENTIANKRYCLGVSPCSSQLPEPYSHDQITSFSVVGSGCVIPVQESLGFEKDFCCTVPAYMMATGCSDGSLKLWRSNSSTIATPHILWELVGKLVAHPGPVSAICLTDNGQKIATISAGSGMGGASLHIWNGVPLIGAGKFVIEDVLSIDKDLVALNWLTLGNGQFMLGVCTQNELRVYAQESSSVQTLVNQGKPLRYWSCVAFAHTFPAIRDLIWGPQAAAVIIHDTYFTLFSQRLFLMDNKQPDKCYPNFIHVDAESEKDNHITCSIFSDSDIGSHALKEPSLPMKLNENNQCPSSNFIAAINQVNQISWKMPGWTLAEISEKLKGSLPVFHPDVLLMNLYSGNWKRAYAAVRHLVECLTSGSASQERCSSGKDRQVVPQILLSNYFDGILSKDSMDSGLQWSANVQSPISSSQFFGYDTKFDASNNTFSSTTKSELHSFVESLEKTNDLVVVTDGEKLQILTILDLLSEIQQSSSAYENLDEPGRRFWVAIRFQQLHIRRNSGKSISTGQMVVETSLMSWAFHSDCQEALLSSFLPNEPSWKEMQILGVGFWFTNVAQLRTRVEKLARTQYLRNRDPKDCALLYIALNRLQVLAGLFKISKNEKDKPLVAFLARDFQEEKNKAAALKNAYVLMGRHQLEMAIAFFLLGGDNYSAVTVCAKNLGDEQLALVICRLLEGRGGSLERQLVTRFILPSATERGDYWLTSLLEWELGNYMESFLSMLGLQRSSAVERSALSSNDTAFMDPHIGLYCLKLTTINCMRNAVGEQNIAILSRWATLMAATAFSRNGLPLEALECLSSSSTISASMDQGSVSDIDRSQTLPEILKLSTSDSINWLSSSVSLYLESCAKVDLVLQFFSKLMEEHPSWPKSSLGSIQPMTCFKDCEVHQYEKLQGNFRGKLYTGLLQFEQKFSVVSSWVIKMVLIWLYNNGLFIIGYDMLADYTSRNHPQYESHLVQSPLLKLLLEVVEDIPLLLSRFIVSCSINCIQSNSHDIKNSVIGKVRTFSSVAQMQYFQGTVLAFWSLRTALRIISGFLPEDVMAKVLDILDLYEFYVHFASAWLQHNSKGLLLMVRPLLISCTNGHTPYEVDVTNLKNIVYRIVELLASNSAVNNQVNEYVPCKQDRAIKHSFREDEKWCAIGTCLWQHMSKLMRYHLHLLSFDTEDSCLAEVSRIEVSSWASTSMNFESKNSIAVQIDSLLLILAKLLKATLVHVSSHHVKIFASFLHLQIENRFNVSTLEWLQESSLSQAKVLYQDADVDITNIKDELSIFDIVWDSCADPNIISESFAQEKINWSQFFNKRKLRGWSQFYGSVNGEQSTNEVLDHESRVSNDSSHDDVAPPSKGLLENGKAVLGIWQKDITKEELHFQNTKEIYKRDGELLEALCINSVNERQAAIAGNRKGIIFFTVKDGVPSGEESEFVWSGADWPLNGWASAESTPIPTCVSPGIGLGSKKGAHLGLGGATLGVGSSARQRDVSASGAFSIPGYSGLASSRLGWEVQEDFEEFIDRPATVENISTRAFSSHPSRPFFLVGSNNTHIYLWEFGKDKATATYGVLPAANVPPPYALASISAVQFDHCGHRFATAALDGTVCTWQLEVGGRRNIWPTESSLCFNGHASDVAYVASSGSIVAAAGYSSNGANVVVWDTLAPPTTSRASILCHEGGARSISVFDNDIGSGSISPLIVTGGKGGDVGLHDFRYIATGKTKRHKHNDSGDGSSNVSSNSTLQAGVINKVGHPNQNGMLWYIPKAHLGNVTKITTIPDTCLFLTGSKDGDVKLWDAKAAKLIHHWPKLHERRTFLQPSSRGFGGVVRPAVTDIQVVSHGFLTCGGDGSVKLIQLQDYST
ncbi:transducin family protein / WD-40 repeat family protein [Euphorbia peplus]|nr:transducin family protein / WD-40 repeat family protein [Euphorbia peplus]